MKKIVCLKCLKVMTTDELVPASRIKGLAKENAAKFKSCPHCKGRTFI